MRRFVLVAGTSAKFWEVEAKGASLIVRWGPLGKEGQTKTKKLASAEKVRAELEKLVAQKVAEGYREEGDAPAKERPRVAWDAASCAHVHPRRASKLPAPKVSVDVTRAWKTVAAAFDAELRGKVKRGRKEATPEDRALIDAAVESFESPPAHPDPVVEAVRAQLLGLEAHYNNMDKALLKAHDALVNAWCAAYGVPFAVSAMIEVFRTGRVDMTNVWVFRKPEILGTYANLNRYRTLGDPIDLSPWHVLRAHLAAADEATYAKARAIAEPVHAQGAEMLFQCALSFVFADEEGWAHEAIAKSPDWFYQCVRPLVSCFRDKPTIRRFAEARALHPELAYDVVDALGPEAFPILRDAYGEGAFREAPRQKALFGAIALIESDPVAAFMKKQRHDKVVGGIAEAYFARCPDLR